MHKIEFAVKRIFDILISACALLFLWPFFLIAAIVIRFTSPGPAIFRQQRLGKDGMAFTMYKFRTMYQDAWKYEQRDNQGATIIPKDDPRVTKFGKFLRKLSLDELPQLINVLKGDMSLVGPRPDQIDQLQYYTIEEKRKLSVKPGMTGIAQINGRNSIPWEQRKKFDLEYVENFSIYLDIKIILQTIPYVLFRRDIYVTEISNIDINEQDNYREI